MMERQVLWYDQLVTVKEGDGADKVFSTVKELMASKTLSRKEVLKALKDLKKQGLISHSTYSLRQGIMDFTGDL